MMLWDRKKKLVVRVLLFGILGIVAFLIVPKSPVETSHLSHKRDVADSGSSRIKKRMEFNDLLNRKFGAKRFYPYWISGNEHVYKLDDGSFAINNIDDESEIEILPNGTWENVTNARSFAISADRMFMAIFHNYTDGYAHYVRTFSVAFIEISSGTKVHFSNFPTSKVQKFKWSPSNHACAYVFGFNIYVSKDESEIPHQLTDDGDEQLIFNGIADWMFWIEITDDDALFWWSPDGRYLAFATINDTGVMPINIEIYNKRQYPTMQKMPYPKAGTNLPFTSVKIVNVTSLETVVLQPHSHVTKWGNYYLNNAMWRSNNIFSPTWKNRYDNESMSESCLAPEFTCTHTSVMMDSSTTGWIGHYKVSHLFPSSNEDEYFTVNSNNGFTHLIRINASGNEGDWRTSGTFEVTDTGYGPTAIYFYDKTWDFVYFLSTESESNPSTGLPRIRHLWKVKARGLDMTRTCITCHLNIQFPDRCNWANPSFSKDGSFLVINCATANGVPVTTVHKLNSEGNYDFVRVAENNTELQQTLQDYYFRERVYGTIKLPDVEGDWYYSLHKPPNFDENKKYPMLVQVYAGPGSQKVQDYFYVSWKDYVASSLDVVVISFDGRGSGYRGERDRHLVYKHLGDYEAQDQISAAKILSEKFKFIDPTRRAIWGWSYGGYATTKVIAEDSENVFKCGYAVAPVTDWDFYHAIYTEKYMLKPVDNEVNYNKSSALNNMENFKTHRYTLIHGTRDENVHFQHSARLNKQLVASDVDFDSFFAADNDHSMGKVKNGYKNLLKIITRQMKSCFNIV